MTVARSDRRSVVERNATPSCLEPPTPSEGRRDQDLSAGRSRAFADFSASLGSLADPSLSRLGETRHCPMVQAARNGLVFSTRSVGPPAWRPCARPGPTRSRQQFPTRVGGKPRPVRGVGARAHAAELRRVPLPADARRARGMEACRGAVRSSRASWATLRCPTRVSRRAIASRGSKEHLSDGFTADSNFARHDPAQRIDARR